MLKRERAFLAIYGIEKRVERAKRRAASGFRILRRRLPEQKRKLRVFFLMQRVRWKIVAQRYIGRTREFALRFSATLISCIPIACLFAFGGESSKASESHLAAAQIIGAALALVLSLSIIPAQRAAELLSMPILRLYARDTALIGAFLVLVASTAASVFLGSLAVEVPFRWAMAVQFLLLGASFDALRRFYSRVLDLLIPSTAIELVVSVCDKLIVQASNAVERLLEIQTASGMDDKSRPVTGAILFANSHVPRTLNFWTAQLEEFARRFVARKDTSATNDTVKALERIGIQYLEARKGSVLLRIDPNFPMSGYLSEISDVLNPIYESVLLIARDAMDAKNERIVTQCIQTFSSMAGAATTVTATVHGRLTAPLAFGSAFNLDRCIQAAAKAQMPDAVRTGIFAIESLLMGLPENLSADEMVSQLRECLFFVSVAGYARDDQVWTFPAVSVMLKAVKRDLRSKKYDRRSSLDELLERLLVLVPFEVEKDVAGHRLLQTFPAYRDLGLDASLPVLLQSIAEKIEPVETSKRHRSDPFADFVDAATAMNHHFQKLTKLDLKNSLLRKWIVETFLAVVRVHYHLLVSPPKGTEGAVHEVEKSMINLMSWLPRFFSAGQAFQEQFATEAADDLVFLGIEAMGRKWWN